MLLDSLIIHLFSDLREIVRVYVSVVLSFSLSIHLILGAVDRCLVSYFH